jgi:hypothetical protein
MEFQHDTFDRLSKTIPSIPFIPSLMGNRANTRA